MDAMPNLTAEGDIYPFRYVIGGAADFGAVQASDSTKMPLGISDHSTFTSNPTTETRHAASGTQVTLQDDGNLPFVEVGSGGTTRFTMQEAETGGKTRDAQTTGGTTRAQPYMALQSGATGEIVRVRRVGGWVKY